MQLHHSAGSASTATQGYGVAAAMEAGAIVSDLPCRILARTAFPSSVEGEPLEAAIAARSFTTRSEILKIPSSQVHSGASGLSSIQMESFRRKSLRVMIFVRFSFS